jgi:predicted dehydrogenase
MTMRVGLIGGGNISDTHARAAKAIGGVEITAVCGTNRGKVERMAATYGAAAYLDFEKFLEHRPMEFVAIGSPSGLHAEQGIAAARRGLHILTEKPLDISTRAADALIAAAADAKVKLGVIFQDRFKADLIRVKEWMNVGILGKPILADARVKWYRPPEYYGDSKWRGKLALDGGGALMNQAIHTVDLLVWLFGDVVRVQAQKRTALHKIEAEDTLTALLEFANSATGVLQATTSVYPGYPRRLELTGEQGTIILEHDRLVAVDLKNPPANVSGSGDDKNQSASSATVSDVRGHRAAIEDFLQAIEKNREPRCNGVEGRRSVALVEAIYAACESGGRVDVKVRR